jgi:hypothetical protein
MANYPNYRFISGGKQRGFFDRPKPVSALPVTLTPVSCGGKKGKTANKPKPKTGKGGK